MNKCVLSWAIALLLGLGIALQPSPNVEPIDIGAWDLPQFVNHLEVRGLGLKVVSTRQDGYMTDSVYLSEDTHATWLGLQSKPRSLEAIDQWQGAVWIERLDCRDGIEWPVQAWGAHGSQIGRFVLFGDASLIERIVHTFER